jgi:hypothetical protein
MEVPPGWDMPREIRAQLGDRFGRQREIKADGHVFLVLYKVPASGISQRADVCFWRNPAGEWRATGTIGAATTRRCVRIHREPAG